MTATLDHPAQSRARRLKELTHETHDQLDRSVMAGEPFANRERYALFLKVQHSFHREIDALYFDPELDQILPDLAGRRRFDLVAQDLADLGMAPDAPLAEPVFQHGAPVDIPTAAGWLYVAEGSNLGAAFLLKAAAGLGLGETFGARHLAAAPEEGLHWKTFTTALDRLVLTEADEARVAAGAKAAFACVRALVSRTFR